MSDFGSGLLVAFGIGLLIFVHELGHFLAARRVGVRVEVFSLGFGPRLLGFRRGDTDYRLSLVPFGGYVAVAGQDPNDWRYDGEECLHQKTVGQRMQFYAGGVALNLAFALIAFPIAFHFGVSFPAPEIGSVQPGSAAWEAELQRGDRILQVNGKATYSFENTVVEIALAAPSPVQLLVQRGDQQRVVEVLPQYRSEEGLYMIGIGPPDEDRAPDLTVRKGGAADRGGLQDGDVLLAINDRPTTGVDRVKAYAPLSDINGPPVTLRIRRGNAEQTVTIAPDAAPKTTAPRIGVLPRANIVAGVRPGLRAFADLRLERGDAILAIDGVPFRDLDLSAVAKGSGDLAIVVQRGDRQRTLTAAISADERARFADHVALQMAIDSTVLQPMAGNDGPAARAGLLAGDRLLAIDGAPVREWIDLQKVVKAGGERALALQVERQGARWGDPVQQLTLQVTPQLRSEPDYGFVPNLHDKRNEVRAEGFVDAVRLGCVCSVDLVKQLYVTLKRLLTGDVAAKNLGGIIQISRVSYHHAQVGWSRFLYFLALLSINLAFLNVLPIPVLDGGHLLFLLIEKIKGSPVSTRVLTYSQVLGLVLVLALVVFVTYNDILRLL